MIAQSSGREEGGVVESTGKDSATITVGKRLMTYEKVGENSLKLKTEKLDKDGHVVTENFELTRNTD